MFEVRGEDNISVCLKTQWRDGGCESRPAKVKEEGCEEGKQQTEDGDSNSVCVMARRARIPQS